MRGGLACAWTDAYGVNAAEHSQVPPPVEKQSFLFVVSITTAAAPAAPTVPVGVPAVVAICIKPEVALVARAEPVPTTVFPLGLSVRRFGCVHVRLICTVPVVLPYADSQSVSVIGFVGGVAELKDGWRRTTS